VIHSHSKAGLASSTVLFLLLMLQACGGGDPTPAAAPAALLSRRAQLGEKIFHDVNLSASGRQSCASCHDAAMGGTPPNSLPVQLGGPNLDRPGLRKAPAIRYLRNNAAFHFEGDGTPAGGFFWDGRAASLAAQAAEPFLNPAEMAMPDAEAVVARLAAAAYAADFEATFGPEIFADPARAYQQMTLAIQAYEQEDSEFAAFTSKYDAFLQGRARLTDQELRGLAWFNSPVKGNCAACHPSAPGADGSPPLFTDFSYDNLGVPRNPEIPANADPTHFDLGLCERADLATRTDLCGAFKVPSLRNVALRQAFFHNGRFRTLKDTITFYVQRDTNPEKWYPPDAHGRVAKFDDLPLVYHANVNTTEAPYDRRPGEMPALSEAEIDDVIAFLNTLRDGYAR
jgi:cytochrome c peroxidase